MSSMLSPGVRFITIRTLVLTLYMNETDSAQKSYSLDVSKSTSMTESYATGCPMPVKESCICFESHATGFTRCQLSILRLFATLENSTRCHFCLILMPLVLLAAVALVLPSLPFLLASTAHLSPHSIMSPPGRSCNLLTQCLIFRHDVPILFSLFQHPDHCILLALSFA